MSPDDDEDLNGLTNWDPKSIETFLRSDLFEKSAKEKYTEM